MEKEFLFETCLKEDEDFQKYNQKTLLTFGKRIGRRLTTYQNLFHFYQKLQTNHTEKFGTFTVEKKENDYLLTNNAITESFKDEVFFRFLSYIGTYLLTPLPLGTVVSLKKEYFKKIIDITEESDILVVITNRFLLLEDINTFIPYGGVLYPMGELEEDAKLYFGAELVETVIHEGYTTIEEDEFIQVMRREVLLPSRFVPMGYVSKSIAADLKATVKGSATNGG